MEIYFENSGQFITARHNGQLTPKECGRVTIRCNFEYTDCGESESLDNFVARHDGELATEEYLKECYAEHTKL